jgi:hypothetical protein
LAPVVRGLLLLVVFRVGRHLLVECLLFLEMLLLLLKLQMHLFLLLLLLLLEQELLLLLLLLMMMMVSGHDWAQECLHSDPMQHANHDKTCSYNKQILNCISLSFLPSINMF